MTGYKVPESFDLLKSIASAVLSKKKVTDPVDFALEFYLEFSKYYNGERFYVPKLSAPKCEAYHREIFDRYNGENVEELAAEYEMSHRHVQRILKRMREASD